MQEQSRRPLKRFVKRVPASGGPPSYKLILPHQVVLDHLRHLIEGDFELATSTQAVHTWQGSIVPRRNKDRREYTLQGWRLWAEAHDVQPGDQVLFELVAPRKMILSVIKATKSEGQSEGNGNGNGNGTRVRKLTDSLTDLELLTPSKSRKSSATASPCNTPKGSSPQAEESPLFGNGLGHDDLDLDLNLEGLTDDLPDELSPIERNGDGTDFVMQAFSEMDSMQSEIPSLQPMTPPAPLKKEQSSNPSAVPASTSIAMPPIPPHKRSPTTPATPESKAGSFSGALSIDDAYAFRHRSLPNQSGESLSRSFLSGHSSETNFSEMCPFLPYSRNDNRQSDPHQLKALIDNQEGMKVNMKNFQGKLDKETRSAIKAAMGLERCVVNILGRTMTGDTAHEDLFSHLSSLKSNLWQMLVMSMTEEVV